MKWGSEEIVKCLDLYAVQTCLWDFNDPNFKNKLKRAAALESILKDINIDGLSVDDLKNKIHSIRNTYTNELRKIENSKKTGSGTDDIYKPKIPWFNIADSFLRKIVSKRKSHSNLQVADNTLFTITSTNLIKDIGDVSHDTIHDDFYTVEDTSCSTPLTVMNDDSGSVTGEMPNDSVQLPQKQPKKKFKGEKNDLLKPLEDAVQTLRAISNTKKMEDDEIDTFTKSINKQMRKLPEEYVVDLMSDIQSSVSQKRAEYIREKKKSELLHATTSSSTEYSITVPPGVSAESLCLFENNTSE